MKYLIITFLLISFNVDAQEDKASISDDTAKNKKRPSWSQGLPERQSSINTITSMNSLKTNTDTEENLKDDIKFNKTEMPNIEIDVASTKPVMELKIEPVNHNILTRKQVFEQYYSSDKKTEKENTTNSDDSLSSAYKWTPIKTSPVNISESFDTNEALKLNIQINPKGDVTRVTSADNSIPRKVFKHVEKSILNWKFQAPEKVGITEKISKTFTIDITTEA